MEPNVSVLHALGLELEGFDHWHHAMLSKTAVSASVGVEAVQTPFQRESWTFQRIGMHKAGYSVHG